MRETKKSQNGSMAEFPVGWHCYLINLPDRKDRLASAKKELARIGWRLEATQVNLYSAKRFTDKGDFVTSNIRGAFHSHLQCLRAGELAGYPCLLIMEDDISFPTSFARLLPSVVSQLQNIEWDICYLGHENAGAFERANFQTSSVHLLPCTTEIITMHLYVVNARVLPRLLDHLERVFVGLTEKKEYFPMPIDGAFNVFRRINPDVKTFIAVPKLGWQRPSRSDITPGFIDKFKFAWSVTSALRDIKYKLNKWLRSS